MFDTLKGLVSHNYYLMFKEHRVMEFNLDTADVFINLPSQLPYSFRGFIVDSNDCSESEKWRQMSFIKDWIANRVLSISRSNAKAILTSAGLPQSSRLEERVTVALVTRALQISDDFWIKEESEDVCYSDVCLRTHISNNDSYIPAMQGYVIRDSKSILVPELTGLGTFLKCFRLRNDKPVIYKSDVVDGSTAMCEIESTRFLRKLGANCVEYSFDELAGHKCSVCELINSDGYYFVSALEFEDYCRHNNVDFMGFIVDKFLADFSDMVISDFLVFNTDRHSENWGFMVNSNTGKIEKFAKLFDFNLSNIHTNIFNPDMIYEPTGAPLLYSARKYYSYNLLDLGFITDEAVLDRLKLLKYWEE